MTDYFWQGEKVRLRALRHDDWAAIYAEETDTEAVRLFEPGVELPRSPEQVQDRLAAWISRTANADDTANLSFAVESLDGEMVGTAGIHTRNPRFGTFGLAARIYRPHRRRGYARDALRILLRYGFWELRYQKANSVTTSGNAASIAMHTDLGFQVEGRVRRNVFTDGVYQDEILFGTTREEFDARERPAPKESQPPTMTLEEAYGSVQPLNRPEDFNDLRDKAIEEQTQEERRALRQAASGMWQDRTDLPDFDELRHELDRNTDALL
ncbi:MAG: GNAT family N-acetyltransferase [Anaerolineae bacterium]